MKPTDPTIVVAPDSFKGSLDAPGVCVAIGEGLRRVWPHADLRLRPMADGGEGTLDAVLAAVGDEGTRGTLDVQGAGGASVSAAWGTLLRNETRTAVIEAAQVVGITDAAGMQTPVVERSTRGVGELLRALLDSGIRHFMIGLGGSSTNDGGAGLLDALGMRFLDARGKPLAPTPAGLASLASVDASMLDPRLHDIELTIMSDVSNPLCGPQGATAIFGPQKGVRDDQRETIDRTLARLAMLTEAAVGASPEHPVAQRRGAGAAGGLGFALQLIGGRFASGAEVVAGLIGLDAALRDADWAITGEGRSDAQTLLGKAPYVVAQAAARAGVRVSLLSGAVDANALVLLASHFAGCFALPDGPATLAECIANTRPMLASRAEQMGRLFNVARSGHPPQSTNGAQCKGAT
jgi:glycerate 2-kinase